jgi:two-component system, NtrC family, response regulator AtoC
MSSILIIDDEETYAKNAARFLARAGHETATAATLTQGLQLFRELAPDVVILDYRLPDGTGLEFLQKARATESDAHIILITGHGTIELAVEAMKAGADDLLTKPVALSALRDRITALAQRQRASSRLKFFEAREREASHSIRGESSAMLALVQRIERIAAVEGDGMLPPVLITGETGTGKELVARACHFWSARRDQPFIEINCAALPAQLLENELFGHERGAFTDAKERKIGLIEAADGGTLFLDEVGEMDLSLQAKLLKVIEDGRFRRIGSVQEQQVHVRIVAATNRELEQRVDDGAFRADLYFRLRVLQLNVPALREREGDAVLLAQHFCQEFAQRYRRPLLRLSPEAQALVQAHHWPGNVRELRNVMEQAVLLAAGDLITAQDLMLPASAVRALEAPPAPGKEPSAGAAGSVLERMERDMLVNALRDAQNNVSQAARLLGISRDTLRYRMEKHQIRA